MSARSINHGVILLGATGGLGYQIYRKLLSTTNISVCYATFRDKKKWELLELCNTEIRIQPICYNLNLDRDISIYIDKKHEKLSLIISAFEIRPIKRIGDMNTEELINALRTNVEGITCIINDLVGFSIANHIDLHIININSGAAYVPLKGWGIYSACKSFINIFLKTLNLEENQIKAVTYEPGVIDTPMQEIIRSTDAGVFDRVDEFVEYHNQGRLRTPELVADDIVHRFVETWNNSDFEVGFKEKKS